jgi:hypothetical protein
MQCILFTDERSENINKDFITKPLLLCSDEKIKLMKRTIGTFSQIGKFREIIKIIESGKCASPLKC